MPASPALYRVPLTPDQYDEYQRVSGSEAARVVRQAVKLPSWSIMTDDQKSEAIRDVFKDARKAGRSEQLRGHSELVGSGPKRRLPGSLAPAMSPPRQSNRDLPPLPPGYSLAR